MNLQIQLCLEENTTFAILKVCGFIISLMKGQISLTQEPKIIVYSLELVFLHFIKLGHSVVVVNEDGQFIRRIGSERVTCFPNGIDISDAGDVLIGDSHGNQFHVAVYDKDSQ